MPGKRETSMENLVNWSFAIKRADVVTGSIDSALAIHGYKQDSVLRLMRRAHLGASVQAMPGFARPSPDIDPDAEAVGLAVETLERSQALLVRRHGLDASRPDWRPGLKVIAAEPDLVWRDDKNKAPGFERVNGEWIWRPKGGAGFFPKTVNYYGCAWQSVVQYVDNWDEVRLWRGTWLTWYRGLDRLRSFFLANPDSLQRWTVTSCGPARRPWETAGRRKPLDRHLGA